MSPTLRRYRDIIVVLILLVVPFFFLLHSNIKHPESLSFADELVVRIAAPVEKSVAFVAHGVSDVVEDYVYLVDVQQANRILSYENARLRERIHSLERLEAENVSLRRFLQMKTAAPYDVATAQVIDMGFNDFFRVTRVVLDRPSADIRPHMPAVTPDGVVGTVLHVVGETVELQLAVDAAFGIDVEDERTHARGFVRGTGDPARYECKVEMIGSEDEVDVGDTLLTSGKGKWFPPGIRVAVVTSVAKHEVGRDQDVQALPAVDFSRLRDVMILKTPVAENAGATRAPSPIRTKP